ncbi:MAG: YlxM family DNA-binding protein [Firmicutes bacterium]|nr:YlxM family DNA-binding protein [Bacillota bacterium]
MKINDIARQSLLYDFYGALLTKRQREVMELYNDENLSLAEIASEFGISRQGVYDALKNGAKALEDYESKLGLVKKFSASSQAIDEIDRKLDTIIDRTSDEDVIRELNEVKSIIDNLEE